MDDCEKLQKQYDKLLENMEELQKIISENKYSIIKGKVTKRPDTLYYMELCLVGESQYEDSGCYKMYREFIELDENILKEILEITNIQSSKERETKAREFFVKLLIDECDEEPYSKYFNNFYNAMQDVGSEWIEEEEEIDYVDVFNEHYKDTLLFEASLKSRYENWHGYISFIKTKKVLTEHNVDYEFSKYFRPNHPWREK
jgi:hypothetical protein